MAETIKIYAVTHDMMMAYRDNYRLSKDEALKLFDLIISELKDRHDDTPPVELVQLEQIEFRRRKVLKRVDLWLSDVKDNPGASS